MKRYCKNVELNKDFVKRCMLECFYGKWKRRDVAGFLADYQTGERLPTREIQRLIAEDKTNAMELIERASEEMAKEISERNVHFAEIRYSTRYDESSGKYREIGVESIKQQIYNYVAVNGLMELFKRKIGTHQCASIPKRGQVYGKRAIERWIRSNPKQTRIGAKADVRQCYPSIDTNKLMELLQKQVKNKDLLYLTDVLIRSYKNGLSIGSYLSQWLCNYYLSFVYNYAEQQLFKFQKRNGQRRRKRLFYKILFYMDDILMVGARKADVKRAMKKLIEFMSKELGLTVKPNWKLFQIDHIGKDGKHHGDPIDMMGFKIYRDRTEIRRNIFLRMRRAYVRAKAKINIPLRLAYRRISYYGWVIHSNSIHFQRKYHIEQLFKYAKRSVRNESAIHRATTGCQLATAW